MNLEARFREEAHSKPALEAVCLASTAFLILWFCQDLVLSQSVPLFRDLSTYFYPLRFTLFQSLRAGTLPYWNRHMAMGFPVMADFQSGAFYPPHLLFLVLSFFTAIRILFVFHFLIAATGTYTLFRRWSFPYYLSIIAALLFTLGGTVVSLSNVLNHFQTAVWLPWILISWEVIARSPRWTNFLALVLLLAVQFLAGSPEFFALSMAVILIDGFRIKLSEPGIRFKRMTVILLGAILLMAGLVMMQLLPTAELIFESRRSQSIPVQEVLHWSLHPKSLLNLFLLDKEVDLSTSVGVRFFFARESPFLLSNYLGAVWTFGMILYVLLVSWREKLTLLAVTTASIIIACGAYTPVYPFLLSQIPVLSAFRFPEKIFYITHALLIYGGVKGLLQFSRCDKAHIRKPLCVLALICVAWLSVYLYLRLNMAVVARSVTLNAGVSPSPAVYADMVAAVITSVERQTALFVGLMCLFVLMKAEKIRHSLFALLLVAVTFVDLSWAHRELLFPLDPKFIYENERVLQQPDEERTRLFYYPTGQNLHPSLFAIQAQPRFKEAIQLFFHTLLPNEGVFYGFDYFQEIDALARRPYTEFLSFANGLDVLGQIKLLRTFNVGYLVSFRPLTIQGTELAARYPQYFSWLYRIEGTIPRVYVVNKSVEERDSVKVLQHLASTAFNPLHEVVLDRTVGVTPEQNFIATAKIGRYEDQLVTVHVSLNRSGILVLADSYYPGWKAYVDGSEQVIRRANLFFRAVPLASGNHTVEFRYEPRSIAIGLAVSLATLLLIIIVSIFFWLRNHQRMCQVSQ